MTMIRVGLRNGVGVRAGRRLSQHIFFRSLELPDLELAHAEVPEPAHGAGVGLLLDHAVLLVKALLLYVLLVAVLHPLDAVHVSQEGPACLVVVAGKGGRGGVTRCRGVHVNIIGKQTLKYK